MAEIPLASPSAEAHDAKLDAKLSSQVAEEVAEEILPDELNADYQIPDVPGAIVIRPEELLN